MIGRAIAIAALAGACRGGPTTVRYVGHTLAQCAAGRAYQPPALDAPTQPFVPLVAVSAPLPPAVAPPPVSDPPVAPPRDAAVDPDDDPSVDPAVGPAVDRAPRPAPRPAKPAASKKRAKKRRPATEAP